MRLRKEKYEKVEKTEEEKQADLQRAMEKLSEWGFGSEPVKTAKSEKEHSKSTTKSGEKASKKSKSIIARIFGTGVTNADDTAPKIIHNPDVIEQVINNNDLEQSQNNSRTL